MMSRIMTGITATLSRLSTRGVAWRLFLTCWLIYVLHFATNTVREIYPALSLGDHLSFDVSEYLGFHPDLFEMPGHGAFINNNPGASMLGAIPYALTRPVIDPIVARVQAGRAQSNQPPPEYNSIYPMAQEFYRKAYERGLDIKFGLAAGVMQALLMAPLSALSVLVMFYILLSLTASVPKSVLLALLYGFATPVLYRTAQLNQNLLVSHCALFAFALLWQPWDDPLHPQRPRYLLAGLIAGWAVVLDYTGLVVLAGIALYAIARIRSLHTRARHLQRAGHPQRSGHPQGVPLLDLVSFGVGAAASVGVLMAYQWVAFGNPFLPAQHYMPATAYSGYGFSGMDLPQLDLLWDTAFGMRFGLFTSAPILLLALWVPAWFNKSLRIIGDRETIFILSYTLVFFLFASASQYGRLQFNSGVRYVVPVVPFLFLLVAGVFLKMPPVVAAIVGAAGTYWSWCLALYRDVEQGWGVFESLIHVTAGGIRLPWLTTLEHMGYTSAVPVSIALLLISLLFTAMLWRVPLKIAKIVKIST